MSDSEEKIKPESYSTAYVAKRLGVSVPTVQRWVDAGHLKAWKTLGGHRRIDARSADGVFRSQELPQDIAVAAPAPSLKVVVVDDNPDDGDLLSLLVQTAFPGAAVTVAENGFQGLLAIGQCEPDVVITDIVMPKMDGIEMLHQLAIQGSFRPPVLIAASSLNASRLAQKGSLPQGVRFVPKPIEPEAFMSVLRSALANR